MWKDRSPGLGDITKGSVFFFFQAEDGIRDLTVTGVQTCALPIYVRPARRSSRALNPCTARRQCRFRRRSEEHTSELQSQSNLVCRLLLEKKKKRASMKVELLLPGAAQLNSEHDYIASYASSI